MRWGNIIFNNFWPKVISLALAIATWFYVFDLINADSFLQKKQTVEEVFSQYNFIMKEVPVKPVFSGKSPAGRRIVYEKVKVEPAVIAVFGPEEVIEDVTELRTDKIDIGEYTRSAHLRLGLNADTKLLEMKDKVVDVFLPVESLEKEAEKPKEEEPQPAGQLESL